MPQLLDSPTSLAPKVSDIVRAKCESVNDFRNL